MICPTWAAASLLAFSYHADHATTGEGGKGRYTVTTTAGPPCQPSFGREDCHMLGVPKKDGVAPRRGSGGVHKEATEDRRYADPAGVVYQLNRYNRM